MNAGALLVTAPGMTWMELTPMCRQSTLFKRCRVCGEEKLLSEFHPKPETRHGYRNDCRECHNVRSSAYYYANRERIATQSREYNAANAEAIRHRRQAYQVANRERLAQSKREAYAARPRKPQIMTTAQREAAAERARQWYAENTERAKQNVARHKELNADAHRVWQVAYRARKSNAAGSHTKDEWVALCERYDYRCLACGEQVPLTVDHVIPLSKGGSNDIENIQPLCKSCNSSKNVSDIDYRQQWREEHADVIAA